MIIREINLTEDYPLIVKWWEARGAGVMPKTVFLPAAGFMVEYEHQPVAASWLYSVQNAQGGVGIIECTTTNPSFSMSRHLVECVKALYAHLEKMAWAAGCGSVVSFVAPETGEQRILSKAGWQDLQGVNHVMYGKTRPA